MRPAPVESFDTIALFRDIWKGRGNWTLSVKWELSANGVFENGLFGQEFLVGLKEYREKDNKGALVFDTRAILEIQKNIKLNFIVNNIFNREYVSRPADIQPPRTFIVQLQLNL